MCKKVRVIKSVKSYLINKKRILSAILLRGIAKAVRSGREALDKMIAKSYPYFNFIDGCNVFSEKIKMIRVNQTIKSFPPKVVNKGWEVREGYDCVAKIPDHYLAEIDNVTVVGGTDLVLLKGACLYDEIDKEDPNKYAIKSPAIVSVNKDVVSIRKYICSSKEIDCGIHFIKDHSCNYFHWLIECLPRLSLISGLHENIPLIVDKGISKQALEALSLMADTRPIVMLKKNDLLAVKKLYYPSQLSVIHDNYGVPDFSKDIVYSAIAINFVRDEVLKKLSIPDKVGFRRIYIARKSSYRHLLNQEEVIDVVVRYGFEVIYPEMLTFAQQVHVFSQASIIIGQSGAGMANFIFAPRGCEILMMVSDRVENNLNLFGGVAMAIGVNLRYLIGSAVGDSRHSIHNDFTVNVDVIKNCLDVSLMVKSDCL